MPENAPFRVKGTYLLREQQSRQVKEWCSYRKKATWDVRHKESESGALQRPARLLQVKPKVSHGTLVHSPVRCGSQHPENTGGAGEPQQQGTASQPSDPGTRAAPHLAMPKDSCSSGLGTDLSKRSCMRSVFLLFQFRCGRCVSHH